MKVSVISTVYDEGEELKPMMESLLVQSRPPDEIVIVDGVSDDGTWGILQQYADDYDRIKVLQQECNIAEGRNRAVEAASHDIILGIDGGCVAEKEWVEKMLAKFDQGADAVAGMFKPLADNVFETVQGIVITGSYTPEALEKGERAPSSRSIGFRRSVWEEAGGYPEDLYTGEDTRFNSRVQSEGYTFTPAPDAVVAWHMRPTFKDLWKQYLRYGEGDARAGNLLDHPSTFYGVPKNLLLISTYVFAIISAALWGTYPHESYLFLVGVSLLAPYCYHFGDLIDALNEVGIKSIPYWVLIVAIKNLGYVQGFAGESARSVL